MENLINIDAARSYATEANLMKALTKLNFVNADYQIVCNSQGRFTAVFFGAKGYLGSLNLSRYSSKGFMTVS